MTVSRLRMLLAVSGMALSSQVGFAQPFLINGGGATLQESFFRSLASTNDFIDVNGDGVVTPSFSAQLAPFDSTPPFMASQHWQMTYRVVGSGNGFRELVDWGATFATGVDGDPANLTLNCVFSDASIFNRTQFCQAGVPNGLSNPNNPGGTPFRSLMDSTYLVTSNPTLGGMSMDFAALDVPVKWFVRQGVGTAGENASLFSLLPGQLGYGQNPRTAKNQDGTPALDIFGAAQSNKLASLRSEPLSLAAGADVFLNTNTAAPDNLTIYDTSISLTPVAAIVNFGVGLQQVKMSDLRHLAATGRRMNGENLFQVTRDSGSGTRNAFMNGVCLDPSWGVGENVGARTVSSANDLLGANYQPSNKGGSSRMEATVINSRLAIGHTGAERGVSKAWLTNGKLELLAVQNDLKGGVAFARPTLANVLNNNTEGYTIIGPATIATIGDPRSASAALGGWGWDPAEVGPNPSPLQLMRNPQASAYMNNITRSVTAVKTAPGANATLFSPGEFLATQFVLVAAAQFTPDPPCSLTPNPVLNPFLQSFTLNDPSNIFNLPVYASFNTTSAGLVPTRTQLAGGATYGDGVLNGSNYVDQAGTAVLYGSTLSARNKIAGDFDGDGQRTVADVDAMLGAWNHRLGDGTPWAPGTNAIIEVLGDYTADGVFDSNDIRYWADGLAINAVSGVLDRQLGYTLVDQAFALLPFAAGSSNFFATTLATDPTGGPSSYLPGDSRGDITNATFNNLPNYVPSNSLGAGADGIVDCYDIDYVYMNFGNFANTADAAKIIQVPDLANPGLTIPSSHVLDLSADMNGDLLINLADVRVLVEGILKTVVGDVNLDGVRDSVDLAIAQGNLGMTGGWCMGDINGDGVIDSTDLALISGQANLFCPADLSGDGVVNASDLANLLANWGATPSSGDLNGDGLVNASDLANLLANWGACP